MRTLSGIRLEDLNQWYGDCYCYINNRPAFISHFERLTEEEADGESICTFYYFDPAGKLGSKEEEKVERLLFSFPVPGTVAVNIYTPSQKEGGVCFFKLLPRRQFKKGISNSRYEQRGDFINTAALQIFKGYSINSLAFFHLLHPLFFNYREALFKVLNMNWNSCAITRHFSIKGWKEEVLILLGEIEIGKVDVKSGNLIKHEHTIQPIWESFLLLTERGTGK